MHTFSFIPLLLIPLSLGATTVSTSYLSLTLPDSWSCEVTQRGSTCTSKTDNPKQAVLMISAKEAAPSDSLPALQQQLSQPKNMNLGTNGVPLLSKVKRTGIRLVDGTKWVEAVHEDSEIKNYRTTYLATSVSGLSILVNFSAHQDIIQQHEPVYEQMLASLKLHVPQVIQQSNEIDLPVAQLPQQAPKNDFSTLLSNVKSHGDSKKIIILAGALVLIILGIFVLRKK